VRGNPGQLMNFSQKFGNLSAAEARAGSKVRHDRWDVWRAWTVPAGTGEGYAFVAALARLKRRFPRG